MRTFLAMLSLIWLGTIWAATAVTAQTDSSITLNPKTWAEKSAPLDYSEDIKDEEKDEEELEEEQDEEFNEEVAPSKPFDFPYLKEILFAVLLVLLLIVLIVILINVKKPAPIHTRIEATSIEEAEENLPEVELDNIFGDALQSGEFKVALRIKFLMVLQALIDQDMVVWKKHKTNHAYEREIEDTDIREKFMTVVETFENSWYGNQAIDREEFEAVQELMDELKSQLNG